MRRFIIGFFILTFLIGLFTVAHAEETPLLDNSTLAFILLQTMKIDLGTDLARLDKAEGYEVMSNALASKGINEFIGKEPGATLDYMQLAVVLYAVLKRTEFQDDASKLKFFYEDGIFPQVPSGNLVTIASATEILNNPIFSEAVAEAYSDTFDEGPADVGGDIPAPAVIRDEPATQI